MRDEEIKRLLENVEVKPSAHCWEAIEGNLAAAAGAAGTAATATKVAGHTLSTAAKIIIGAVGAAAIATTAVILSLPKADSVVPTQQYIENQIVISDSSYTDEIIPINEETTSSPTLAQNASSNTPQPVETTADESPVVPSLRESVSSEPVPQTAEVKPASTPAPNPAPKATSPTQSAPVSIAPAVSKPATQVATTTETAPPSTITDLSDPVLDDTETLNSIDFTPPVALIIPNVITPNGDGYNDVFIIKGIEQTERNRLIIRNSNGTIVFQTVNYRNDWGAPNIANGTYFYQFVYTLHGIDETRTGTLTIMR